MPKSLNEAAMEIISPLLDDPTRYGARIAKSAEGATLVDFQAPAPPRDITALPHRFHFSKGCGAALHCDFLGGNQRSRSTAPFFFGG